MVGFSENVTVDLIFKPTDLLLPLFAKEGYLEEHKSNPFHWS